ncbi:MAG: hypothetical protein WCE79_19545 [Xanthobacteraceae bacterium]
MTMKDFQITVDFRKARRRGDASAGIDIAWLVRAVPGVDILAGDPSVSVQVRVDERQQARLRSAVEGFCVVEDYADLELY